MLGHKVRDFKSFTTICLEDLVPRDNFYSHVWNIYKLSLADNFFMRTLYGCI